MNNKNKCIKCSSETLIPASNMQGNKGVPISIQFYRQPDALLFKKSLVRFINATICGDCGNFDI